MIAWPDERLDSYVGGPLAVSAVPGAGKTHRLTDMVVRLITERGVAPAEVLVLTYMRDAAEQLRWRLESALAGRGHPARGLTVTTIHAFSLSLLQRSGSPQRRTLSEPERSQALFEALDRYLEEPHRRRAWELAHAPAGRHDDPRAEAVDAARSVLSALKLNGLDPARLPEGLSPELAFMAAEYEAARRARGAIDFDDQIREALDMLETRPEVLGAIRRTHRWVFEDEAQDSTPAQTRLLELVAGPGGHLVRFGDPNQAITGTFTASDPRAFGACCDRLRPAGRHVAIATSSRSGPPVLAVANALLEIAAGHPDPLIAGALTPGAIAPGPLSPRASECGVAFYAYDSADHERLAVLAQVRRHLAARPEDQLAVLLPTNREVGRYCELFSHAGLPVAAPAAPQLPARVIGLLERVLAALALPEAGLAEAIAEAEGAWRAACGHPPRQAHRAWLLGPAYDPTDRLVPAETPDAALAEFLVRLEALLAVRHQAPYPLLLEIGLALLPEGPAREVLHRVAAIVGDALPEAPDLEATRLAVAGLGRAGGRDLLPRHEAEGPLRILTVHRAKGAEFDAVWLPSLGCRPAGGEAPVSAYPWEPAQVRIMGLRGLVARAALLTPSLDQAEALATARREAVAERLRLLYVGLTRARRHLVLSWQTQGGKLPPPWHIQALAARCRALG